MANADLPAPIEALGQPASVLWTVLAGEAIAAVYALADAEGSLWVRFGLASLAIQWSALAAQGILVLLRQRLRRWPPPRSAGLALLLLLATSGLATLAGLWLFGPLWPLATPDLATTLLRHAGIALVIGLLGLAAFDSHWRARQLAVRAKQLELEALQARVRPHFLFNTLNTCVALVHAHPDAAERALLDLADLFRSALREPQQVPLASELELTRRYLDIEALRLGARLQLTWDVPEPPPAVLVPSLSIQPLAENAIGHGIEALPQGGRMEVRVHSDAAAVDIVVANDLPGCGRSQRGHALGLASARARVLAMSGGRARIEAGREHGRYVVRMRLPATSATGRTDPGAHAVPFRKT